MSLAKLYRSFLVVLATFALALPGFAAAKRRAVETRSPGVRFTISVTGVVLDATTNQPVRHAKVTAGIRTDTTDAEGKFSLKNATGYGVLNVEAERSGYVTATAKVNPGDTAPVTMRMTPTKTITVHRGATTTLLDIESVKFGYPVPFSGYRESSTEEFCKADGTQVEVNRDAMQRLAGPATLVDNATCCNETKIMKMTLTLKTGETSDVFFTDTCGDHNKVDVGGRDHISGEIVHIPITEINEIVFP